MSRFVYRDRTLRSGLPEVPCRSASDSNGVALGIMFGTVHVLVQCKGYGCIDLSVDFLVYGHSNGCDFKKTYYCHDVVTSLKRKIVVFLPRVLLLLSCKLLKGPDHTETGVARLDDIVYVAV